MNHLLPSPWKEHWGHFKYFSKICGDIHKSRCTTGINDTGGKFSTGINDTSGKFWHWYCWWSWYQWQICRQCQWHQYCHCLPLVSTTLVANNWNLVLRRTDSWKKPEVKNFVALSLKVSYYLTVWRSYTSWWLKAYLATYHPLGSFHNNKVVYNNILVCRKMCAFD